MSEPAWVVVVALVLVREGRVLSLRRAAHRAFGAGIWETVSGRVEPGEALEEAARREAREEVGAVIAEMIGPVDAYVMARGDRPMAVVVYAAEVPAAVVITRSDEHDAEAWWTLEEARAAMPARLADAVERAITALGRRGCDEA